MAVVYIADQGASVCKRGDRIYVFKGQNLLRWFHTKDISQLIIVGNIAMTSQALSYLLKHGLDTVFLSYYGKYKGRLVGEFGKNVYLRYAQFTFLQSEPDKNALARQYVLGKIANMRFHLEKRARRYKDPLLAQNIIRLSEIKDKLATGIYDIESIRGYEGIATKYYFSAFPALITNPDFPFSGRNRRPPKDEVNALLSLGYTFLMNQIMTSTYICGLDPYFGALHELNYGRQSLVLDLMEEFRPLIDNLVISCINRRELRPEHFCHNVLADTEDADDDKTFLPVSMSQEGMKVFITAFAKLINSTFASDNPAGNWVLRDIFQNQARKIVTLFEKNTPYEPFLWH